MIKFVLYSLCHTLNSRWKFEGVYPANFFTLCTNDNGMYKQTSMSLNTNGDLQGVGELQNMVHSIRNANCTVCIGKL